jgi:glutamate-1-semialdehyde 2,1-aminomutase
MTHEPTTEAISGLDMGRFSALLEAETDQFHRNRPKSAALLERARKVMPDGVPMAWMVGLYDHLPPFFTGGQGARFTDADGHSYIDFNLCDLSNTVGYGDTPPAHAVARAAMRGPQALLPTTASITLAERLAERTGMPFWQHTVSASSANTEVFRIASVMTAKPKVVMFHGGYHGHIDQTMVGPDSEGKAEAYSLGPAPNLTRDTIPLPFNDLDALRRALAPQDVAVVIAEPAMTNCGLVLPDPGFLEEACRLSRAAGAIFVLDEAHTWQMAYGGFVRQMRLDCDVVTLGKGLGSGVALGLYGMTAPIAAWLAAHHDGSASDEMGIATGGTLYGNPLSTAAALSMLEDVQTEPAYARIARLGTRLSDGIDAMISDHGLPWRAFRYGPRSGFCLTPDLPRNVVEAFASMHRPFNAARRVFMANRGIWDAIYSAGPQVGFAHDEADIDRYLSVASDFLDHVT